MHLAEQHKVCINEQKRFYIKVKKFQKILYISLLNLIDIFTDDPYERKRIRIYDIPIYCSLVWDQFAHFYLPYIRKS